MMSIASSARLLSKRGSILSSRAWFSTSSDDDFVTGVVKFYDKRKAWGIVVGNDQNEYFIHRRSIVSWLPFQEDTFHPYLVATEKVRFKPSKSYRMEEKSKTMEATFLTNVDGSQVLAYRSNYISGNKKRLSHLFGEQVYLIMEDASISDEQKHAAVVDAFQQTKEKTDIYIAMMKKQFAAMGTPTPAQNSENETQVKNEDALFSEEIKEENISSTS